MFCPSVKIQYSPGARISAKLFFRMSKTRSLSPTRTRRSIIHLLGAKLRVPQAPPHGLAAGLAQSRPVRNGPRRAILPFQERRRAWKPLPLIEESDGRGSEAWFTRLLAWIAGVEPAADSLS